MNCTDCRFSDVKRTEPIELVCRRHPPQLLAIRNRIIQTSPYVDADTWCGEWEADTDSTRRRTESEQLPSG